MHLSGVAKALTVVLFRFAEAMKQIQSKKQGSKEQILKNWKHGLGLKTKSRVKGLTLHSIDLLGIVSHSEPKATSCVNL